MLEAAKSYYLLTKELVYSSAIFIFCCTYRKNNKIVYVYRLSRVLIFDWDIHHGNGIQHAFYDDPRVLYISTHRYDNAKYFPYSTDADYTKIGEGEGKYYNVNIPWNNVSFTLILTT